MHHALVGRALAMSLALGLLGPATVLGQAVGSPSVSDAPSLAASMLLTVNDLPAGMGSDGVTDGSAFTIDDADFTANGGLAVAEQTWSAEADGPVLRVFDFRFLFPTPDAAQAYLDAAGPTLSEAASGLSEVSGDIGIGDGYRHFSGEAVAGEQVLALQNVLFRIGPVVAKVYIGGYGTTDADVTPIFAAAGGRIENPSAGGGTAAVTPIPTAATATQPTLEPTAEPTTEATAQPTTTATAGPTTEATAQSTIAPAPGASPSAVQPGSAIVQWASAATASSEYGSADQWSAASATGPPNVPGYSDDQRAWVPKLEDGTIDQLDLRFDQAVIPTAIGIYESFNPGFVTKVEAYHTADGTWVPLWEGADATPGGAAGVFSPPLAPTDVAVDRIRITVDTNVPDWNEIDAVELMGATPH